MLHATRWKCRTQKIAKSSPSGHHRTALSGYIFDNRKKLVKFLHMSSQYGELLPTNGWERFTSLRHPCKFQRVSRLGSVTARARHSSMWASAKLCGVEQRAPPIFGRATITLGIGPHSSFMFFLGWDVSKCRLSLFENPKSAAFRQETFCNGTT